MKKLTALLAAAFIGLFALAAPASADSPKKGEIDGKDVTLCHYAGSNNNGGSGKYTKITVDVNAFFTAGHIDHSNDIWEAFSYVKRVGSDEFETINVPAQGDTSRLAFKDCKKPEDNEKVAVPEPTYLDPCGTKNDVFSVAPGRGYTVGDRVVGEENQSITVTLEEDFEWTDGSTEPVTFTKPLFTDIDCDLPETGVGASFNTTGGYMALGALAVGGAFMVTGGRRKKATANI